MGKHFAVKFWDQLREVGYARRGGNAFLEPLMECTRENASLGAISLGIPRRKYTHTCTHGDTDSEITPDIVFRLLNLDTELPS